MDMKELAERMERSVAAALNTQELTDDVDQSALLEELLADVQDVLAMESQEPKEERVEVTLEEAVALSFLAAGELYVGKLAELLDLAPYEDQAPLGALLARAKRTVRQMRGGPSQAYPDCGRCKLPRHQHFGRAEYCEPQGLERGVGPTYEPAGIQ